MRTQAWGEGGHQNACKCVHGGGGSRLSVRTFCFLGMLISMSDYDYPFSEALHRISCLLPIGAENIIYGEDCIFLCHYPLPIVQKLRLMAFSQIYL